MLSPALLSLAIALPQDAARGGPAVLTAPAPRDGRTRVELVLLGEPWPEAVARTLRVSGTDERPMAALEDFLDERQSSWVVRAREFGLEIVVEGPDGAFEAVLGALTPALVAPRWTEEARGMAATELLVARVPGQFDPVARADRALAGLLDPRVAPPAVLDVDLGALMAAAGGDGDHGADGDPDAEGDHEAHGEHGAPGQPGADGGAGGGGAEAHPDDHDPTDGGPPPGALAPRPLTAEALEAEFRAYGAGGLAARVSAARPSATVEAVRALLVALGDRARGPALTPDRIGPADWARHLGGPSVTTRAADAMTPGAIVALAAELDGGFADWSDRAVAAWAAGLRAALAGRLALQPGTAPRVVVRRPGEGVPSVRVTALVEPTSEALAPLLALVADGRPVVADADAIRNALDDPQLAYDPTAALVGAALGRERTASPAADGGPPLVFSRLFVTAPADLLPAGWRLDLDPLAQSPADARALRRRLLDALGGGEAWTRPTSVALTTEVEVGPGRTVTTRQWRDLRAARLRLEQQGEPRVVTTVDDGRATQQVDRAAPNQLPLDLALALCASHRGSLLVTLADLARGELSVVLEGPADGSTPAGRARLRLADRLGDRGVLTVDADGLPVALEQDGRRYTYAEWIDADGRRVPTRVERVGSPPVVYRWRDVVWDPPTPAGL